LIEHFYGWAIVDKVADGFGKMEHEAEGQIAGSESIAMDTAMRRFGCRQPEARLLEVG
jgi:hypothetical protein